MEMRERRVWLLFAVSVFGDAVLVEHPVSVRVLLKGGEVSSMGCVILASRRNTILVPGCHQVFSVPYGSDHTDR